MWSQEKTICDHKVTSLLKDYPSPVYHYLLGNTMYNKNIVILEDHHIIMRRDYKSLKGKVKIIGGGGAGIEPGEVNYVGKGMLTAAVIGEMFKAPSADEILIAIRELAYENSDGILMLVKNYLGDKLNFGLALEKAVEEDINVKMLVVGDDIVDSDLQKQERKGLAGSVLLYKIAGEMAEQDKTLDEIIKECKESVLTNIATAGATFAPYNNTTCYPLVSNIGADEMILGMGIYGQYGIKRLKFSCLSHAVLLVLTEIIQYLKERFEIDQCHLLVLVNNFGTVTKLEEGIIAMEVSKQLNESRFNVLQMYVGTFISNLNSKGFSITLLKVRTPDILKYLEAPTSAPAWPKAQIMDTTDIDKTNQDLPNTLQPVCEQNYLNIKYTNIPLGPFLSEKAASALKQIALFAAEAIISCERQLNTIDSEVGDGDIGTALKRGADALKEAILNNKLDFIRPVRFLLDLSEICSINIGGLSGALYRVFFESAAKIFQNVEIITPELCCAAFKAGVKAIKYYGKAELGDRTILDALCPAVDTFESATISGKNLIESVSLSAATCEFKSEETKQIKPLWWLKLNIQKPLIYADAGAHAVSIWLRAISEGLKLAYPTEC